MARPEDFRNDGSSPSQNLSGRPTLSYQRYRSNFNKKSCRLISFTDVSFKQNFQLSQSFNYQIARELTATNNLVVGALEESKSTIDYLFEQVASSSLKDKVS